MRTSELATRAGVNVQTLRYYERRGLLAEPDRLGSGYRAYSHDAVGIVRFVKRAQAHGFSLEEVRSLLDLAAGGPEGCDAAKELAEEKIGELSARIASLSDMRDSLRRLVDTCSLPPSQRECPLISAIGEDPDAHTDVC